MALKHKQKNLVVTEKRNKPVESSACRPWYLRTTRMINEIPQTLGLLQVGVGLWGREVTGLTLEAMLSSYIPRTLIYFLSQRQGN